MRNATADSSVSSSPPFTRCVMVVVDALRSDMVFVREEMIFLRQLLSSRRAVGYLSRAHSPTVTMPRIKALVTGTVPRFADLFRNLASGSSGDLEHDNLIKRWRRQNKTLVFHGDDTWLKLFPAAFHPMSDGTSSSFFTPDFVEVDLNVTRHLPEELDPALKHPKSRVWDALILHYLGLDHIGHQLGPSSARMSIKLVEMDNVLRTVYNSVRGQDKVSGHRTLVVLLSDHGMSQSGNHGGNSPDETSAVAAFMAPSCDECHHAGQGDMESALQVDVAPTIGLLLGMGVPDDSVGVAMRAALEFSNADVGSMESANLQQLSSVAQQWGIDPSSSLADMQAALLRAQISESSTDSLWTAAALLGLLIPALLIASKAKLSWMARASVLGQALSLFSSSAVENEHAMLFSLASAGLLLLCRAQRGGGQGAALASLLMLRAMRSRCEIINFAKVAGLPPPTFAVQGTSLLAWGEPWPISTALGMAALGLSRGGGGIATWIAVLTKLFFFPTSATAARLVLGVIALDWLLLKRQHVTGALLAVFSLLHRQDLRLVGTSSAVLLAAWAVRSSADGDAGILVLFVGQAVHFALGQSMHSVASIDIAPGYTFSTEFNRELVALLTLLVTYSGPLLAVVAMHGKGAQEVRAALSLRLFVVACVTVAMRQHLFIWSVFAPRFAFEAGHFVVVSVALLLLVER